MEPPLIKSSTGDNKLAVELHELAEPEVPPLGVPEDATHFWFQRKKAFDENAVATQPSVYDDTAMAKEYQPRADWENIHRFNPLARWTWKEEKRVVRKIDTRMLVVVCLLLVTLEIDRANMSQALTDNFLEDLHMDTNDYNLGKTVFEVSYLLAEIPSQQMGKWLGPDRWIPFIVSSWSIVASCQFWLSGRTSYLVCRALLGILQGGFQAEVILYLSSWYKHHELAIRLSFFYTAMSLADIGASFLAVGLLHMRGVAHREGWRWLFLIEGLMTLVLGILASILLPPSACQTANWIRGKNGWFNNREEEILVNRVIRDDPSKGLMHNRQPITLKMLWKSLKDFDLWPMYLLALIGGIPAGPPGQYFTLNLKRLGYNMTQANLLTIPAGVLHVVFMLALSYSSEILKERSFHLMIGHVWEIPCLVWLIKTEMHSVNKWVYWTVLTLLLSHPNALPICVGWNSRNSNTIRTRAISAAVASMSGHLGGIAAANVYQKKDAPNFHKGNEALLAICILSIGIYGATKVYYIWRNKTRDRKWDAMSADEKLRYLETTKDEGNRRLDFRFAH